MTEQALAIQTTSNIIQKGDNLEVQAQTPDEMKEANVALITWCDQKIRSLRVDFIELEATWKAAKERKWKFTVLKRHAAICKKRIIFYGKLRTALKSGWYIVPNFPVSVFAIRTDKTKPLALLSTYRQNQQPHVTKDQQTASLPHGEGEYVSPNPVVSIENFGKAKLTDGREVTEWSAEATDWNEVDFPLCMAKPKIMEAVGRAMEIKLFDDFGVLSDAHIGRRGCGDPIIVGRIRDPRSTTYHQKMVSFIIAWSLETRTL